MATRLFSLVLFVGAASCHLVTPFEVRASADGSPPTDGDADTDGDGDADTDMDEDTDGDEDADTDMDADVGGGAVVLVASATRFSADRICDVDGDGSLDNAIADLGDDLSGVFVLGLNVILSTALSEDRHPVFHFEWVDDLAGPNTDGDGTRLATYLGNDRDYPPVGEDDLSGDEPFYADASDLDERGEPRYQLHGARLDDGAISAEGGEVGLSFSGGTVGMAPVLVEGTVGPHGESFQLRLCGHVTIDELGRSRLHDEDPLLLSLLEALLAGGSAFGADHIPGLEPDADLDGDGLESFVLDADGRILSCIDGDRTVIEGRDCWQDERMADGISLTFDMEGVGARFGGRAPAWEYEIPVDRDLGPPPDGFFSTAPPTDAPPAGFEEQCDPWARRPCEDPSHRCSGAGDRTYRCLAPCTPAPCEHGPGILGACTVTYYDVEPLCWMLAPSYLDVGCEVGTTGCTTQYGVSGDTLCFARDTDHESCAERCGPPEPSGCPSNRLCAPNAFEPGGVCFRH